MQQNYINIKKVEKPQKRQREKVVADVTCILNLKFYKDKTIEELANYFDVTEYTAEKVFKNKTTKGLTTDVLSRIEEIHKKKWKM